MDNGPQLRELTDTVLETYFDAYIVSTKNIPGLLWSDIPNMKIKEKHGGRKQMTLCLLWYRKQIENFVDDVIKDNRKYIDRNAQIEVIWNCPAMYKEEITYSK